jgi:hypothetical protein
MRVVCKLAHYKIKQVSCLAMPCRQHKMVFYARGLSKEEVKE